MSDLIERLQHIERLTPALLIASCEEAADRIEELERELEKAQNAIKSCAYGPCPTLAAMAWEEFEGEDDE